MTPNNEAKRGCPTAPRRCRIRSAPPGLRDDAWPRARLLPSRRAARASAHVRGRGRAAPDGARQGAAAACVRCASSAWASRRSTTGCATSARRRSLHYQTRFRNLVKLVCADEAALARVEALIRERLGDAITVSTTTMPARVGAALRARGATLAVARVVHRRAAHHEVPGSWSTFASARSATRTSTSACAGRFGRRSRTRAR